jgi:hypothetical protein
MYPGIAALPYRIYLSICKKVYPRSPRNVNKDNFIQTVYLTYNLLGGKVIDG